MALGSISQRTDKPLTNAEIQRLLGMRVARDILGAPDNSSVEIGSLARNYYSFIFSVKVRTPDGRREAFVKIPKVDMRGTEKSILPLTPGDREMARDEEQSLRLLDQKWDGDDLGVRWVSICGVIPEFNAIVTNRVFADEAFAVFRRLDLRRRLGFRRDARRLQHSMACLGSALGRFHEANSKTGIFRMSDALPKFEFYCRELSVFTGNSLPERIVRQLRAMGEMEIEGTEVPTLKGLDIRNVLIDARHKLYLLDPGKTKYTHREADLARFLMTYRVLFWGSKIFLLVQAPDPKAEAAFLEAYSAGAQPLCGRLLDIFLLKEQLKHWHTAIDSLRRLPWSPTLKRLVARIYVNPFYTRQVTAQCQCLAK